MFRMRRFRLFLVITILSIISFYELSRLNDWDVPDLESLTNFGFKNDEIKTATAKPNHLPPTEYFSPNFDQPKPDSQADSQGTTASTTVDESVEKPAPADSRLATPADVVPGEELLNKQLNIEDESRQQGHDRLDAKARPSGRPRAYWNPQKEHFPVDKHIRMPDGEIKPLPQIQHNFGLESSSKKSDRIRKQRAVREAFKHAWSGYKRHAIGHDELKPVTNSTADTFNGWGATLVDALDTMWIMGLHTEFEEATKHVAKIDFKTSSRKDIPMFETTIRYLGGLIAAYDVSGAKYAILLDKAIELANILLGAFDTPNRMPVPFYRWAPPYASQPHRASSRIVMAELGSLAVEFTRLAQITKEAKYYDAIARVTNALEEWQMKTTYPGVWPVRLDASGCKKPDISNAHDFSGLSSNHKDDDELAEDVSEVEQRLVKRQLDDFETPEVTDGSEKAAVSPEDKVADNDYVEEFDFDEEDDVRGFRTDCELQGLSTEPQSKTQTYSIAAMADSTYEYFPKQHALLGGLSEQYKKMYFDSMETIRADFLFRPMIEENRDILFLTKYDISPRAKRKGDRKKPIYEATHLGCFAGAMFALGSKVFGIPSDMPLAEKLTDGCVWAYESTRLGIMAEEFTLVPCESKLSCTWNETRWREWLDPYQQERFEAVELYNSQQLELQKHVSDVDDIDQTDPGRLDPGSKHKRQLSQAEQEEEDEEFTTPSPTLDADADEDHSISVDPMYVPKVGLSHKKYVDARILEERLPPGYVQFHSREYKLRPEAIESVFIMYRLTGEEKWREKGWQMFKAIEAATRTASGHGTVKDVTSELGELRDTMESFWLAETLKYFYLLFSEESLVSLDEWVLNTEAHPFKLPK